MHRRRCRFFWLVVISVLVVSVCQVKGEESQKVSVNLVSNPSFEQPVKDKKGQALNWDNYECGYTRSKDKSYAPDILGSWSCKITGSGKEEEVGFGGASMFIRGLPEHGTFTATNSIYITPGIKGKIYGILVTVNYTDGTQLYSEVILTPDQVSANLDKWKTYSRTFSTAPDKKIDYIVYWCILKNDGEKFIGTVYFDEAGLKLVDEKAEAKSPLPFLLVNKAEKPPTIDGRLNDECWQENLELAPFLLISGNNLATQQTKAYLTYDQKNIYIFMDCFESILNPILQKTSEFKAEKTEHDSNIFEDDCVEIFIRPPEKEAYYHLAVNSRGAVYDAKCSQPGTFDKSWDSHASVKTLVTKDSWSAEIGIPFQFLETTVPGTGDIWRINLCREEKAFGENSGWSPTGGSFQNPNRFGEIVFGDKKLGSALLSVGNLQKGENYLQASFFNGGEESGVVTVKTLTRTTGVSPSVERVLCRIEPGKKETVTIPYTVGMDSKYMSYEFWQDDNLLYSSPLFPIQAQTVFMVKTQIGDRNYIKSLCDFYLVEGELLYLPLVLPSDIVKDNVKECQVMLEVPALLRLINPFNRDGGGHGPASVTEKELVRDGIKYRQYIFTFKSDSLTFPDAVSQNNFVVNPLLFKSEIIGAKARLSAYKIYYQVFLNNQEIISGNAGLTLLPPFTQKRPESVVISNWPCIGTYYSQGFYLLGKEEQAEIVSSWMRTGFNVFDSWSGMEELVKNKAIALRNEIPDRLEWICSSIADIGNYLRKHPEERTVTQSGQILEGVISPAYLLKPGSLVGDMVKQYVGKMAQKPSACLAFDYERTVVGSDSLGFDPANLELFRKFAGIPQNTLLTPETAVKSYRQQWIDFRCRQNAELIRLLNEGIKEANPGCMFFAYSGYQNSSTQEIYGINWQYVSPYVDEVWCGYSRAVDGIKDTLKVIGGKPLVGGELVWLGYGSIYNLDETEINLFRRLTDCGGGVMVYYDWSVDGRFYKAVSQVASVATDFEGFFKNFDRDDSLAEVVAGEKDSVAVLKNGSERLLFLFNDSSTPKIFKLKNRDLPPEIAGIDYWGKKAVNLIPILEATVPAYKVTVIYLRNKNSQVLLSAPRIIGETEAKFGGSVPFLAWDSKNSGSAVFELEYSSAPSFPDSATKKITGLIDNYYRIEEPVENNKPYYWRVRTVDLVTDKKSEFSESGSFMSELLLNVGVQPLVFSPNGDGIYDTVAFQVELRDENEWSLEIMDKADKSVHAYFGKGKTVSVVWDGKNTQGNLVPDGFYTMRLKVEGNILIGKKVELNLKYGVPNTEIEKWCSWLSATSNGALADNDYHTTYDKYSYSLLLKGEQEGSSSHWSNYGTGTEIPITAGKQYTYSAYLKTDLKTGEAKISLHFFTKDNRWAPIPGLAAEWDGVEAKLTGDNDWKKVSVSSQAPDNAVKAVLFFSLKGTGTCWLGALDFREAK